MSNKDIFSKCKTDGGYFGQFRVQGDRYFSMPVIDSVPGTRMTFHGKEQIMWSINNYLGLAGNEDIKNAAKEALDTWSISSPMGSRMMSGNTSHHVEFEKQLADYLQKESSILFNFGYMGVAGTITSLVGKDDIIVMDKLAHASIVDAAMNAVTASGGKKRIRVYKHNNMDSLEKTLQRVNQDRKGGVLVLTEGVYGMTGDVAQMDEICKLKDKYEARVFVDDAHGFGVVGENGRGIGEHFHVQDQIDVYFGTFAKSFASIGGVSAANKDVIEWIRYNARTQIFAKSLPMVYVKSLQKTLDYVRNGKERRKRMFNVSRKLSNGLRELGFYVGDVSSPIVPVFVPGGSQEVGTDWIRFLRNQGVFVTGVAYPVIPKGYLLFRMIPTASHTEEDIQKTLDAFKTLRDEKKLKLDMNLREIDRMYGKI